MKKQSGFTLIELLIAFVIGLIIVAATIGIYIATIRGSSDTIKSARLNHDLESVMALMTNDIRRAGYWGGAVAGADSRANLFTAITGNETNIQRRNFAAPTTPLLSSDTADCILYTYDANGNGNVDSNEYYGFRRNGNTINMRLTGTATSPADCTNGSWEENIAGDQIAITSLTFDIYVPAAGTDLYKGYKCLNTQTTLSYDKPCSDLTAVELPSETNAVETREIVITLTGSLFGDNTVTKTLINSVKVRNDRIFKQP